MNEAVAGEHGTIMLSAVNTGSPPWQVGNTRATLTLRNAGITRATRLDPNGYAAADVPVARSGRR